MDGGPDKVYCLETSWKKLTPLVHTVVIGLFEVLTSNTCEAFFVEVFLIKLHFV